MTPEEAETAYENAPSIPIADAEIGSLVEMVVAQDRRKWIPWRDECDECGGDDVRVLTVSDCGAYDGDTVKCHECGKTGYVEADEDGCCTVWNE